MPIKIPTKFFKDLERTVLNFIHMEKQNKTKQKQTPGKTIFYSKGTSGGITIPDIKLYYRATELKTAWYWHKNRQKD